MQDHVCDLQYRGIGENLGSPVERWECSICGREEFRPYTGTQESIEWRV